ncbi:MAG TPA: ABC transporter ATP-binding protein [candidate division Zixibacteria bacterium]|nr:ABC transporter ATP-binding protein [candidate division Zixibacteria bacterium]
MTRATSKYNRLWQYLKPYWKLQLLTLLVMVILTALMLALPGAIQYMIDTLIPNLLDSGSGIGELKPILMFGGFLLVIYLLDVIFSWVRDYLAAFIGTNIIKDLRIQLFSHLQKLSIRFHGEHQTGEVMSRLLSDVGRLQDMLSITLLMFVANILMLLGILVYLLRTNWMLTLVAVIPVPLTVFATSKFGSRLNSLMNVVQQTMAELSARLQESLLGIKTIKAYGQESREEKQVESIIDRLNPMMVKASITSSLGVNLVQFINMMGPIVVLAWGVYLVATGEMKLGELIAFYILLTYLYAPVRGIADTHIQVKSAMASVDRIFEYLDIQPEIIEAPDPVALSDVRGEIRFDNVGFAYGQSGFIVTDLSLHVRPQEKIGLIGASGCGKTTVVNLLMRFFDPQKGSVSLDGVDLRNLSLRSLRQHVALVEQDPMLFRMSIYDNIAYGHPEASEAEIVTAAKAANIHDFVMSLPDGYRTQVGERGVTVSGGERQRLCLARAIVKNPAVLILDEATSALDSESERLIKEALKDILADKTAIIIAHRSSTIEHVDRVIMLDSGRIINESIPASS